MKRFSGACLILFSVLIVLFAHSCADPMGVQNDTGRLSISPGGSSKAALLPATQNQLHYTFDLSGPGPARQITLAAGQTAAVIELAGGTWTISAAAFLPDETKVGSGSATVEVTAGRQNSATIHMVFDNANLKAVTVTGGSLVPPFNSEITDYTAYTAATADISGEAAVPDAEVTYAVGGGAFSGTAPAGLGSNQHVTIKVEAGPSHTKHYEVDVVAVTVSSVTISPPGTINLARGGTQQFTETVTTLPDLPDAKSVTWSRTGNSSSSTTISSTGFLSIGTDESAASITVTAVSTINSSQSGSVSVFVQPAVVTSVTVSPSTTTIIRGSTGTFTATVNGTGYPLPATWSVSGNGSLSTTISAAGLLTVAADETATSLTVTATSPEDPLKSGNAVVTIPVTVTGVSVSPSSAAISRGSTGTFTATVNGAGGPSQAVTWSVSGNSSPSTTISTAGLLTVAAGETATSLTVTAVSTQDTSKSGTAAVIVPPSYTMVSITGATVTASIGGAGGPFINAGTTAVTVDTFNIGETELTYELWYTVRVWALSHGYAFANPGKEGQGGTEGAAPGNTSKPVTAVSWRDAVVWCNAYSELSGKNPCYRNSADVVIKSSSSAIESTIVESKIADNNGFRLPTEKEWEFAARGGNPSVAAWTLTYAGSNTIDDVAWYNGNAGSVIHAAKGKNPNAKSLYDMSGNVAELCWDLSGSYVTARGGAYDNNAETCEVGKRDVTYHTNDAYGDLGFRIASN